MYKIKPVGPGVRETWIFLKKKKNIYIYIYSHLFVQLRWSSLWHVRSLAVACKLLVVACGIWFPDQGWNPGSLCWEYRVLATGPPGKSSRNLDLNSSTCWLCDLQQVNLQALAFSSEKYLYKVIEIKIIFSWYIVAIPEWQLLLYCYVSSFISL